MTAPADRTAPCPRCSKPASLAPTNPWRPFCGERCKLIDLGKWASGEYSIPADGQLAQSGEGEEPEPGRRH